MKSIFYLVITNMAIMLMISIVVHLFGLDQYLQANNIQYGSMLLVCAIFGFGGSFVSLLMSKTMVKRSMGVQVIESPRNETETWLFDTVKRMSKELNITMPEVGVFASDSPNAFATGASKNKSLVAVSTGLLKVMTRKEVEAVIGHEMSHVNNGDMVTSTLLQGVLNTFVFFLARIVAQALSRGSDGRSSRGSEFMISMVMQMVLGFFASLIVFWFSRHREYHADAGGASLTSKKDMADALRALLKIQQGAKKSLALPDQMAAFGITALSGILSTHPPLEKRIAALEERTSVIS